MFNHFDFPTPFTSELHDLGLVPYRANSLLKDKVNSLFTNPINPYYKEFIDISTNGSLQLVNDMSIRGIALTRYYLLHPQQFNNSMMNIELQILIRMWKQMFKHYQMQSKAPIRYMQTSMKLLPIADSMFTELIRVVKANNYIQHGDDMVKKRLDKDGKPIPLRYKKPPNNNCPYLYDISDALDYEFM